MKDKKINYIVFGASGDLANRYLFPALENLNEVKVVSISRKDYGNLKILVDKNSEKIFHLAIPSEGVPQAVELIRESFGKDVKILLEKPFGHNLASARELVAHVKKYFDEAQIYRVDHYLAKKSVQEIIKKDWSRDEIEKIEVVASEEIGIAGRADFYEKTGALQDFVQSHLLEIAALVLSGSFQPCSRCEALKKLAVVCDITKHECVKRGQYEGYRQEVGNPESMVETYVSINMVSNDPAYRGVPITLKTGKALKEKRTEVRIKYKDGHNLIFTIMPEPDAYERVISSAIAGDQGPFMSEDEVLESWRILDSIQQTWKNSKDDLIIYKKGSSIDEI